MTLTADLVSILEYGCGLNHVYLRVWNEFFREENTENETKTTVSKFKEIHLSTLGN